MCANSLAKGTYTIMDTARLVSDSPTDERTDSGMTPVANKDDLHDINDPRDPRYSTPWSRREDLPQPNSRRQALPRGQRLMNSCGRMGSLSSGNDGWSQQ